MDKIKSLEQSIEKTISILGKLDIETEFEEFDKYQNLLTTYCYDYRQCIIDNKIEEMKR